MKRRSRPRDPGLTARLAPCLIIVAAWLLLLTPRAARADERPSSWSGASPRAVNTLNPRPPAPDPGVLAVPAPDLLAQAPDPDPEDAAPPPPASAAPRGPLSLPELIALGLERSPRLRATELAIERAEVRVSEAEYGWTPKLEANLQLAPMPRIEGDDADFGILDDLGAWGIYSRNELEFVMPVFTFFKLTTAEELARVGVEVEVLRRAQARLEVTRDVARAYYGLQLTNALLGVLEDADGMLDKAEGTLDRLLDEGSASVDRADRYQLDVARAQFELRLVQARQARRLATDGLRVHTRLEGPLSVPDMNFRPDRVALVSLEDVEALARRERLDLRQLARGVEAQRLNLELEQWRWAPDIYIAGRVSYAYSNAVPEPDEVLPQDLADIELFLNDPFNSFGFGALVGLRWQLDPVQRALRVEQAGLRLAELEALQEIALSGALLEVEEAYFRAAGQLEAVEVVRRARRAAKRRMTQLYADYEIGGGDVDQLVRAVTSYFEQRAFFVQALHDFRLALINLQLVTGVDDLDALLAEGALRDLEPPDGQTDSGGGDDE